MRKSAGELIKDGRIAKAWSQKRLAEEISRLTGEKISRVAVSHWERGNSKTQKPENLMAAADALGLDLRGVIRGDEPTPAATPSPPASSAAKAPAHQFLPPLTEEEAVLLEDWRQLSRRQRDPLRQLIAEQAQVSREIRAEIQDDPPPLDLRSEQSPPTVRRA